MTGQRRYGLFVITCVLIFVQCYCQIPASRRAYNTYNSDQYDSDEERRVYGPNKNERFLPAVCGLVVGPCDEDTYYRNLDGSCNNLENPSWGTPNSTYIRLLPAKYGKHCRRPRRGQRDQPLPSARLIRTTIFPTGSVGNTLWNINAMIWGQFMTHDMALLKLPDERPTCCTADGKNQDNIGHFCFPIKVPLDDATMGKAGIECLNFTRTVTDRDLGCVKEEVDAQQINVVTSYLDLSNVYGLNKQMSDGLRSFRGGRMIVEERNGHIFLPNEPTGRGCFCSKPGENVCYKTGDSRANQNPNLVILQTIFVREHNRLAGMLADLNPHWDDEKLFQEARRISIAAYQKVSYYDWLPIFMGGANLKNVEIIHDRPGYFNDYDSDLNPAIYNEHSHAAFRYFHTHIVGIINLLNTDREKKHSFSLSDWLHRPQILERNRNVINEITLGMITQNIEETDDIFVEQITDKLFACGKEFGSDLRSTDIQRDRDHGLAYYNDYRKLCGFSVAESFDDYADLIPRQDVDKLKSLYTNYDDVDLTVGGSLETQAAGAQVGPTFLCIMNEQFLRTRQADRFFFEHFEAGFSRDQLAEIRKATVTRLYCDNGDGITDMQPLGFTLIFPDFNPLTNCSDIPSMDLSPWQERKQNKAPFKYEFDKDKDMNKNYYNKKEYIEKAKTPNNNDYEGKKCANRIYENKKYYSNIANYTNSNGKPYNKDYPYDDRYDDDHVNDDHDDEYDNYDNEYDDEYGDEYDDEYNKKNYNGQNNYPNKKYPNKKYDEDYENGDYDDEYDDEHNKKDYNGQNTYPNRKYPNKKYDNDYNNNDDDNYAYKKYNGGKYGHKRYGKKYHGDYDDSYDYSDDDMYEYDSYDNGYYDDDDYDDYYYDNDSDYDIYYDDYDYDDDDYDSGSNYHNQYYDDDDVYDDPKYSPKKQYKNNYKNKYNKKYGGNYEDQKPYNNKNEYDNKKYGENYEDKKYDDEYDHKEYGGNYEDKKPYNNNNEYDNKKYGENYEDKKYDDYNDEYNNNEYEGNYEDKTYDDYNNEYNNNEYGENYEDKKYDDYNNEYNNNEYEGNYEDKKYDDNNEYEGNYQDKQYDDEYDHNEYGGNFEDKKYDDEYDHKEYGGNFEDKKYDDYNNEYNNNEYGENFEDKKYDDYNNEYNNNEYEGNYEDKNYDDNNEYEGNYQDKQYDDEYDHNEYGGNFEDKKYDDEYDHNEYGGNFEDKKYDDYNNEYNNNEYGENYEDKKYDDYNNEYNNNEYEGKYEDKKYDDNNEYNDNEYGENYEDHYDHNGYED